MIIRYRMELARHEVSSAECRTMQVEQDQILQDLPVGPVLGAEAAIQAPIPVDAAGGGRLHNGHQSQASIDRASVLRRDDVVQQIWTDRPRQQASRKRSREMVV
jgi:hypothetical protein